MVYCLFRHAAAHTVRGLVIRTGERILLEKAPAHAATAAVRKLGPSLARRIAGRGLSRWLPVVGAVGVGAYAYYDTMRVATTTIELFRTEFIGSATSLNRVRSLTSSFIRGASPLGLPHSVARSPLRRSLRSAGSLAMLARAPPRHGHLSDRL